MHSKLDETTNFLDLYTHACGTSEVPYTYHLWCGLSLLASAVADRVWITKFAGKKLAPNLYVGLVGPSANGKGEAIDTAVRLSLAHPKIALYNGKASPQFLMQWMTRKRVLPDGAGTVDQSRVWFVTPELSMALGKGDSAFSVVTHMTELFAGRGVPLQDGTITRGAKRLDSLCVNWLFGSVLEWLCESMPPTSVSGGMFGRIVAVYEGYVKDRRVPAPKAPPDYDEVMDHLHARLIELVEIDGEFTLTPLARERLHTWYTTREWPLDESLVPAFRRQDDLVLKLSMLLSLAESLSLIVNARHVVASIALSDAALKKLADIQAAAVTSPATRGIVFVQQYLRGMRRPVMRAELLRRFWAKGYGDRDALEVVLKTLEEAGSIAPRHLGRGRAYLYQPRRRLPADDNGTEPA